MIDDRVIYAPEQKYDAKILHFKKTREVFKSRLDDLTYNKRILHRLINRAVEILHVEMRKIVTLATDYVSNVTASKKDLVEQFVSEKIIVLHTELSTLFKDIRSRGNLLADQWYQIKLSVLEIWKLMLEDKTTWNFYNLVYNDVIEFLDLRLDPNKTSEAKERALELVYLLDKIDPEWLSKQASFISITKSYKNVLVFSEQ